MESSSTRTIASFTGTLLRREHELGQKFVQLIFRENDQDWLCVSSDTKTAKLPIGKTYQIEGVFKQLGERAYIHEPQIAALKRGWLLWQRISFVVVLLMGLVVLGGVVFTHQHHAARSLTPNDTTQNTAQNTPITSDGTDQASQTPADTPTIPADTPTPTPTAPAVTPKKNGIPPATAPVATALAPHCDGVVTTTLDPVINQDPTQPTTYVNVTQQNIDRQVQTCYPDAGNANGNDTVIAVGQPLIETVGTAPDPGP